MRKAILAALAVLCSVGGTEETTETHMFASKEPGVELMAQCGGGGAKTRSSRTRSRRADDGEKSSLAKCGRKRRCSDCDNNVLAGKCKDGNCKRPGVSPRVA